MEQYSDEEKLKQYKQVWLTHDVRKLVNKEKKRLKEKENRKVSIEKLVNNAVIEKYS
jgi:hypothetical protein